MRKILVGLGVVVVILLIAAVAVPFFIPADALKDRVVAAVKDATGRDFTIAGPLRLHFLPSVGVEASDVRFANAPGAKNPEMATLGALNVSLKVLPLISGDVEVDTLVLSNPVIHLEIDHDGHPNWSFGPVKVQAAQPAAPPPAPGTSTASVSEKLKQLRLGKVKLENATITYDDVRSGKSEQVTNVGATVTLKSLDDPLTVDAQATWHDQPVTLDLSLEKPRAAIDGGSSPASIKLASKPVTFGLDGTATAGATPGFNGTIDLAVPSIRDLAAWAGSPLHLAGSGLGPLAIKGKLAATGAKAALSDVALSLDAIKGAGALAVDVSGAKPQIDGKLALDGLDVNPYLPPAVAGSPQAGAAPAAPAAPAAGSGWSDAPIDLSGLKAANANLDLSTKSITYGKIEIGETALVVALAGGKMTVDLNRFGLYSGTGTGQFVVDGSGAENAIASRFKLDGVQAEPLLTAVMNFGRLSGSGAFECALTAHGQSQRALVGTLDGTGAMHLVNGAIKGINLAAMLRNVTTAFTSTGGDQKTDFASLDATFTSTNGILKNSDLALLSPLIRIGGSGTIDLPQQTVNYRVEPKVVASAQGQGGAADATGLAVPVVISGPWSHPSYQPDLGALLQQKVNPSALLKGAKGSLGGGKPADMLKGLLGH